MNSCGSIQGGPIGHVQLRGVIPWTDGFVKHLAVQLLVSNNIILTDFSVQVSIHK